MWVSAGRSQRGLHFLELPDQDVGFSIALQKSLDGFVLTVIWPFDFTLDALHTGRRDRSRLVVSAFSVGAPHCLLRGDIVATGRDRSWLDVLANSSIWAMWRATDAIPFAERGFLAHQSR